ncbi:MAG: asparagine synthase (glutamine-hydrolyzing), partial [Myxococcales bacterium]|nr:asparagine synthase (glutamine-hydrolyzing) [Myxococcales bacterium]
MCGLVGYAGRTPVVSAERLAAMRDTLSHRGPDDAGLWIGTSAAAAIGLGHRRLSILDTRTVGRQPMALPGGRVQIIFNGEIYNFLTLRAELEAQGHRFETRSDTEVLLHLYQVHGAAMVDRLIGMFAFAIWDADAQRLLVVRDRLGIKPVFYGVTADGGVVFGSEVKALLAAGVLDDGIDLQAMHDYLGLTYSPGPRTLLRGIKKLPPAHTLTWTPTGGVTLRRYWRQRFHSQGPARRAPRFEEAAEQTLDRLQTAVKRRLIADVPLGMFLSGGIDSSAVLWAMAQASSGPVKAFTIGFEEAGYDERQYAAIAAQAFGAEHHVEVVRPDPDTFMGPLTEAMDEPFADSSAIPLWYLCRVARRHVTVSLGGDGGDELYAGYRTHFAWRLGAWYRQVPSALRARVPQLVGRLPVSHGKVSFDLKARQFVHAAEHPAPVAHYRFKEFFSDPARRALHGAQVEDTARLFEEVFERGRFRHELDGVLASDFAIYLPDDILVKVD